MNVLKVCKALTALCMAAGFAAGTSSHAAYPDKPIHIVIGYAPGGVNDIIARIITPTLSQDLGQPIIIDNRPGANSIVGGERVAHSPADGYTFLLNGTPMAINASLYPSLPYNTLKDFDAVGMVTTGTFLFAVNPTLPVKSVAEFIALAKAKPGTINFCSSGEGSPAHLIGELFKETTQIDIVHIPYKGAALCMADILSGHVQVAFEAMAPLLANIKAGKLRALAVMSAKRSTVLPELPTIAEASGYPNLSAITWYGLFAPAHTPSEAIAKMNAALDRVLKKPDIKQKLADLGLDPAPGTPQELQNYLAQEVAKWAKVVQTSGAKVE